MSELLNQLLDTTRAYHKKLYLNKKIVDIASIIKNSVETIYYQQ